MTAYLQQSIALLKTYYTPVLISAAIIAVNHLPRTADNMAGLMFLITIFLLFVLLPLFYGQYVEIILNGRPTSYLKIFKTHWLNFFLVSIMITLPVLVFTSISLPSETVSKSSATVLSFVVDVVTIYVFPLVFILHKKLESISLGIKILYVNFKFSLPLVGLAAVPQCSCPGS